MRPGLDAIGEPDATVIVSNNFAETVQRIDPSSGLSDRERGYGVVGGRTIHHDGHTTVVLDNAVVSSGDAFLPWPDGPSVSRRKRQTEELMHVAFVSKGRREVRLDQVELLRKNRQPSRSQYTAVFGTATRWPTAAAGPRGLETDDGSRQLQQEENPRTRSGTQTDRLARSSPG